jgi:hypothetical protein
MLSSHERMAMLTRAGEICEPLDDRLLARRADSFGQQSGNTSGIGTKRPLRVL